MKTMLLRKMLFERMLYRGSVLALILCFFVLKSNAQSIADFQFVQPNLPDQAACFLRDSKNYLWIGTNSGLYRYDGLKLRLYTNDAKNPKSISGNKIISMVEDADSNIWIAPAYGALCLYNRDNDSFVRFKNNPSNGTSISGDITTALFIDKQHNLWVGVKGKYGLNKWNPRSKTFTRYRVIDTENNIEVNTIFSIAQDKSGNIWIADDKWDGLFRFEPATRKTSYYPSKSFPITTDGKLLFIDKDDRIWISTWGLGLFSFNPQNKTFTKYSSTGDGTGTNGTIISNVIHEDDNHLLIGVDHGGINRYNKKTGLFEYIVHDLQNPEGLNSDGVWSLYKDGEGILWVGTTGGGVNICNPKAHKFRHLKNMPGNQNSLSNNGVNSLYEDSKAQIWMTTEGGGINVYTPRTGSFKHYQKDKKNPYSLQCNVPRYTVEDRNHDYWFGTWDGGLIKLDHRTERFTQYLPQSKAPFNITGRNIWTTMVDNDGLIWLSIFCEGIDLLDPDKGIIKKFLPDPKIEGGLYDPVIQNFYQDSHSTIWVLNNMKLSVFDSASNSFKIVPVVPDKDVVITFIEDKEGFYWLGTAKSGLIRFTRDGAILKTYSTSNGLAHNAINGVLEDNHHNLWVSTGSGISRVNYKTGAIRNYTEKDGLQGGEFWQGAYLKTRSGEMYFGGGNGVNCFFPESLLKDSEYVPPVYIDEFLIFNKAVTVGQPGSPLQKVIEQTKKIVLNWEQSVFTFGFSAINYTYPENARYAYKMEGFDREWNYTDASRRSATYTNLNPGKYTFRVKASNNDGVWNETGTSVEIIILPPWWRTWWFITVVVLFVLGGTLGSYFYRITVLQKQKQKLEDAVKARTQEIERNRQFLQAFLDNAAAGMFAKDREGRYLLLNSREEEYKSLKQPLVGHAEGEVGQNLGRKESPLIEDVSVIEQNRAMEFFESIEREDGTAAYYKTVKFPIYDLDGNLLAIGGITDDITDTVAREVELEDAIQKAEDAVSSQERFLASMSHDMRTPLNGVVGMINLMEQTPLSTEQKEYLEAMKVSSYNLRILINDILDVSKIQAGKLSIECVLFDLNEILDSVRRAFIHEAKKKGVLFSIEFSPDIPTMLEGDPSRLSQILNNLIGNALKFTSEGFVKLKLLYENLMDDKVNIEFVVEDSGIGISEEGLDKLFQPFVQASSDTTRNFGGSGLGLSICKSLVELQQGEIGVSSTLGKGSTFRFNIPYLKAKQEKTENVKQKNNVTESVSVQPLPPMRCLLAEDNLINQKVAFHTLRKVGIQMDIANNGKEAVDILKKDSALYDFVLMDIQMPVMDGYQATITIRKELGLEIPIIAMTASVLKGGREQCMEVGMNGFVPKPFMLEELLYVIGQLTIVKDEKEVYELKHLNEFVNEMLTDETKIAQSEFGDDPLYSMQSVEEMEDVDFTLEILNIFLDTVPKALEELKIGVAQATDWDTVTKVAHKLKGSVGVLQMTEMIKQLQTIELNAKSRENLDQLPKALDVCCRIYAAVKDEIVKLRDETMTKL